MDALLIYTMLAGGCTGSTGGGIKNMRLLIVIRNIKNEFNRLMHPRAILSVKVNRQAVSPATISTVSTFILFYLICIFCQLDCADVSGYWLDGIFQSCCFQSG